MKPTNEEKHNLITRYQNGASAVSLCDETNVPRSTLYSWIRASLPVSSDGKHYLSH